jgi:hypothetical protein
MKMFKRFCSWKWMVWESPVYFCLFGCLDWNLKVKLWRMSQNCCAMRIFPNLICILWTFARATLQSWNVTISSIPPNYCLLSLPSNQCVRFEIFTAVSMMLLFWALAPCRLGGRYWRAFSPEDGDSMFLRNIGIQLRVYTAPKSRRRTSNTSFLKISSRGGTLKQVQCFTSHQNI